MTKEKKLILEAAIREFSRCPCHNCVAALQRAIKELSENE
jgi:hypothetical protein